MTKVIHPQKRNYMLPHYITTFLLEPVDVRMHRHLYTHKSYHKAGKPVMMVKKLKDGLTVSDYLFFTDDGESCGEWYRMKQRALERHRLCSGVKRVFQETFAAAPVTAESSGQCSAQR
jgi:hypothetical protein